MENFHPSRAKARLIKTDSIQCRFQPVLESNGILKAIYSSNLEMRIVSNQKIMISARAQSNHVHEVRNLPLIMTQTAWTLRGLLAKIPGA